MTNAVKNVLVVDIEKRLSPDILFCDANMELVVKHRVVAKENCPMAMAHGCRSVRTDLLDDRETVVSCSMEKGTSKTMCFCNPNNAGQLRPENFGDSARNAIVQFAGQTAQNMVFGTLKRMAKVHE